MRRSYHPHPIVAVTKIFLTIVMLSAILLFMRDTLERVFFPLLVGMWGVALAFILIAFITSRFFTLSLEDNVMVYQAGIISLRRIVIPYIKITEASYTQGLIQRIFKVGTLNVDTAGGADIAIHMNDIKYDDLKKILDEINNRSGKTADDGT